MKGLIEAINQTIEASPEFTTAVIIILAITVLFVFI